jgi:hypothetical protein
MEQDELLWAAVWLYMATGDQEYKGYIAGANNLGWVPQSLGWDNKFIGAQALVAKARYISTIIKLTANFQCQQTDNYLNCRPSCSSSFKGSCPTTATTAR